MSQSIMEGMYGKLTASQIAGTLYAAVGGRIYSTEAPENATLPLCVFSLITTSVSGTFPGYDLKAATFQVDLYGPRTGGGEVLGDINTKLFALLQEADLTVTGHDLGRVTCTDEGSYFMEGDALRIISQWRVEATAFV